MNTQTNTFIDWACFVVPTTGSYAVSIENAPAAFGGAPYVIPFIGSAI
jgi:hypothetical protein